MDYYQAHVADSENANINKYEVTMVHTVLKQNVNSIKIASVNSHLDDNLLQIHILTRKITQMGNFL